MSRNRRKRRTYIDAGDGITIATSVRGPLDPETEAAFIALARAAAARMQRGTPVAGSPPLPDSDSPSEPRAGQDEARQARQRQALQDEDGGTASPLPSEGSGGEAA